MNLGLDSFVFIDDNPAERALVRAELPQVEVPEMPVDPSDYIRTLANGLWFETLTVSKEDLLRVRAYKENAARVQLQHSQTDLNSYLIGLEMRAHWDEMSLATLQRVTQLINKTNQFNLTNSRYTESQVLAISSAPDSWIGTFSLADRFGDHGLISAVILYFKNDIATVDTWVMSCRVFSRGMEDFIFQVMHKVASQNGCRYIHGKFVPTMKNSVVAELYKNMGGTLLNEQEGLEQIWSFDLSKLKPKGAVHIVEEPRERN